MNTIWIYRLSNEKTVVFAARQLRKYLAYVTNKKIRVKGVKTYDEQLTGLWLGTFSSFPKLAGKKQPVSEFDDHIYIDVRKHRRIVAGVNPRSVLLATYRYLFELGFRWVRPGKDGQFIPEISDPFRKNVLVSEKPSYRHRCVCIEGAVSWEHVRDMIDWLPKVGFNSYFVQFRDAYQFWLSWYHHELNPRRKKEPFTTADAKRLTSRVWEECDKRGLITMMTGHGWTCEPFDVRCLGWMKEKKPPPARIKPYLAEVNGKRQWYSDRIIFTQLCYSNSKARKIMVKDVVDYAEQHPDIPIISFVLADGFNNHCECARCRKLIPTDWYVKLCNEIDAELTRRDLPVKIVVSIYADCIWPPKTVKLENEERFIATFAPISRTYSKSLAKSLGARRRISKFALNETVLPRTLEENLAYLRAWQRTFKGDSFHFDYHLMWDHFKDIGHYDLARVAHEDILTLGKLGLNGFVSCQTQRCFVPSALIMTVMGRTLWNRDLTFEEIADDLYKATFGRHWRKVKQFTQKLSVLSDPAFLRRERDENELGETVKKLRNLPVEIRRFGPTIEANLPLDNTCHVQSWKYLKEYVDMCEQMAVMLESLASGDYEETRKLAGHLYDDLRQKEPRIHRVFDVYLFIRTIDELVEILSGQQEPEF